MTGRKVSGRKVAKIAAALFRLYGVPMVRGRQIARKALAAGQSEAEAVAAPPAGFEPLAMRRARQAGALQAKRSGWADALAAEAVALDQRQGPSA